FDRLYLPVGHRLEPRKERLETGLVFFVRRAKRPERPSMERIARVDDLVPAAVGPAPFAGELYRALVGLRPAVTEKYLVCKGVLDEEPRELGLLFDVEEVRDLH